MTYATTREEYKERPMIVLWDAEKNIRIMAFGVRKASAVLGALDDIKAFVEEVSTPKE